MRPQLTILISLITLPLTALAGSQEGPTAKVSQPLSALQEAYSGKTKWEPATGNITFTSSGVIDFKRDKEMAGIWTVPENVTKITIAADVRVTGQFTLHHSCTIEGIDQKSSVLFGTDTPELLNKAGLDKSIGCIPYSAVFAKGDIDIHVKNLTTLNPLGFMWTGKEGARIHLDRVRGIDDRGGWHNHSDGISAAAGSTVRNCYLETGDDAIKLYADITVEDTTIKMIQNCVPIQLGWGSYGDNAHGTFRNLTNISDQGRDKPPAVIIGRAGEYRKSISIDGLTIKNPNAAFVSLHEKGMTLDLEVKNANIDLKQFWAKSEGTCKSQINGTKDQTAQYRTGDPAPE